MVIFRCAAGRSFASDFFLVATQKSLGADSRSRLLAGALAPAFKSGRETRRRLTPATQQKSPEGLFCLRGLVDDVRTSFERGNNTLIYFPTLLRV